MFVLGGDVAPHGRDLGKADGEHAVAGLPCEIVQIPRLGFDPEGGAAFEFLDDFGRGGGAGERGEEMDVIFDAADDDRWTIEPGQDAAEVTVEFVAEGFVTEEGAAVFGGEDGVDEDFGEGLGHGRRMRGGAFRFNPFGVGNLLGSDLGPRRTGQPQAE